MVEQAVLWDGFSEKIFDIFEKHKVTIDKKLFKFTAQAINEAQEMKWEKCILEFRNMLIFSLGNFLTESHVFLDKPYVRTIDVNNGKKINIAIINQQSKEWYGTEDTIQSFDFILEDGMGIFDNCKTFVDIGAHQCIWSIYYAMNDDSKVIAFEPSILNCTIGMFNILINNLLNKIELIPYAVGLDEYNNTSTMLVDFMTIPIRTCLLNNIVSSWEDFVKVDIEGYEYEMLSDNRFVNLLKKSKYSHFELHLGHLIKRNISLRDCVAVLKSAGLGGFELYSQVEMYTFLETADPVNIQTPR